MDWLKRMNEAINYIEENLDQEIDYDMVAKITCCSIFHFGRIFTFASNMTLGEYIRQRRLSRAALDLINTSDKVIV